jgi:hypothetical protein
MKAVVLEIHKKYCIMVTEDGQFLKQDIPAGNLEIGDEIIVEKALAYPAGRNWLSKLAIAAAVVAVVGLGGFGLYKILPVYLPGMKTTLDNMAVAEGALLREEAPGEEEKASVASEETAMEMVCEESAEEPVKSVAEAGETEDAGETDETAGETTGTVYTAENIPEGAGQVDAVFDLEMAADDQPVEMTAGNLIFLYRRIETGGVYSLSLIIENLSPDYKYSGIAALEIRTDEGIICGLGAFEFNEFSSEDEFERGIDLSCPGDIIRVELKGQFE